MKRIFTFLFLIFLVSSMQAQFTLTPEYATVVVNPNELETIAHGEVQNVSTSLKKYRWERITECITAGWESQICDNNLCYSPATSIAPKTFQLNAFQKGLLDVHVRPYDIQGGGKIKIRVWEDADPTVEAFMYITFNECTVLGSKDVNAADLKIFPNPTTSQFQLSKTDGVKKIEMYSIVGSHIKTFIPNDGEKYDVADLNNGIYMVRLVGAGNKVLKTIRLSIR